MLNDRAWWVVELTATVDSFQVSEVDGPYLLREAIARQKSMSDQTISERWTMFLVASGHGEETAKRRALMAVQG